MNSDTLIQLVQNGFRVTLGATTTFVEVLQDSERREENLAKLKQEWSRLSEEWATKGEVTEQEARNFVDNLFEQRRSHPETSATDSVNISTSTAPPNIQMELQELTARIATLRAELEQLKDPKPGS